MAEFGLLWCLWRRALRGRAVLAAAIAIGYAVTDEMHQPSWPAGTGRPWTWRSTRPASAIAVRALGWRYSQPRSVA